MKSANNTISASYKPASFLPSVNFSLCVEAVSKEAITLKYTTNVSMILDAVISFVSSNIPEAVRIDSHSKSITVYPQQIKELKKALEFIYLRGITVEETSILFETAFV